MGDSAGEGASRTGSSAAVGAESVEEPDRAPLVIFEKHEDAQHAQGQAEGGGESDGFANLKIMDSVDSSTLFSSIMGAVGKKKPEPVPTTKGGKVWSKMRKNRTKVIAFLAEESEQEKAELLRKLVEDYKTHGRVSANREIRVHVDPATNRYVCPMCARQFMVEGNLMAHLELTHMAEATSKASKIHERRFGFENRSAKLIARIAQIQQSITTSHDLHGNLDHTAHEQSAGASSQRSAQTSPKSGRHAPRIKSPLEVPINRKNPGRPSNDDENETLQSQLAELKAQARLTRRQSKSPLKMRRTDSSGRLVISSPPLQARQGSPGSLYRVPSNLSMSSSVAPQSPPARNRSPDTFARPAGLTPRVHQAASGLRHSSSNVSLAASLTGKERPTTAPESPATKWFLDPAEEDYFDVVHPLKANPKVWPYQTEGWDTYLPDYVKVAGQKGRKFQLQLACEGVEKRYVSVRQKTPDLFADTIVEEEMPEERVPRPPSVRPLSRQEAQTKREQMEQQNFERLLEWMYPQAEHEDDAHPDQGPSEMEAESEGLDHDAPLAQAEREQDDVDRDLPSSLSDYWARNPPSLRQPANRSRLGTASSQASSRPGSRRLRHTGTHQFYRDYIVDKRRDPRPTTAPHLGPSGSSAGVLSSSGRRSGQATLGELWRSSVIDSVASSTAKTRLKMCAKKIMFMAEYTATMRQYI